MCDSIEQVADWHALYLQRKFGNPSLELKDFVDRLMKGNPEAARAEAIVFAWFHHIGLNPEVNEKAGTGGMDFRCHPPAASEFLAEVTSYGEVAVSSASGLQDDLSHSSCGSYRMITKELRGRVQDKIKQLSTGGSLPRLLIITSEHPMADSVLDRMGATLLLASDPRASVQLYDYPAQPAAAGNLDESVFLARDTNNPQSFVPRNRSASAVLLVPVLAHEIRPVGVIHPNPIVPFAIHSLPQVPLLRMVNWAMQDGKIATEWTLPSDPSFSHQRIR